MGVNNKKAFTLVELLSVIVLIAIISLIATPVVLNIINDSKDSGNMRTAELYLNTAKLSIARINLNEDINPTSCEVTNNGNLRCAGITNEISVEMSKQTATSGTITFQNGKIINVENLVIDNYTYNMENNKLVKSN